jgi:hypothetical protein
VKQLSGRPFYINLRKSYWYTLTRCQEEEEVIIMDVVAEEELLEEAITKETIRILVAANHQRKHYQIISIIWDLQNMEQIMKQQQNS